MKKDVNNARSQCIRIHSILFLDSRVDSDLHPCTFINYVHVLSLEKKGHLCPCTRCPRMWNPLLSLLCLSEFRAHADANSSGSLISYPSFSFTNSLHPKTFSKLVLFLRLLLLDQKRSLLHCLRRKKQHNALFFFW